VYAALCTVLCCGAAEAGPVSSCADDGSTGTLRYEALHDSVADMTQLACSTITLTQGAIRYNNLAVEGSTDHRINIVGSGSDRLFLSNSPGGELALFDLDVSGGRIVQGTPYIGGGACVLSLSGSVFLNRVVMRDCKSTLTSGVFGGAIYARYLGLRNSVVADSPQVGYAGNTGGGVHAGQFHCYDSSVRNNSLSGTHVSAGGVYTSSAVLKNCTIEGNSPGGLRVVVPVNSNAATRVESSTFSDNAGGYGLEVDNKGTLSVTNSTVSGNDGGISARQQTVTIANSTIAFNLGGVAGFYSRYYDLTAQSSIFAHNAPYDVYLSQSHFHGADNLVMYTNATDPLSGDTVDPGAIVSSANPRLAPLGFHGGETRTHALLPGSPALDHGNNSANLTTDQRGAARASPAGKPDIGAYERQPVDDELFYDGYEGDG